MQVDRRSFIEFLGAGIVGASVAPIITPISSMLKASPNIKALKPSDVDKLILAKGLDYEMLIRWGDPISKDALFGFNNDYIAYLPENDNAGLLWVNHEYVNPMFVSGITSGEAKSKEHVIKEMDNVGGSLFRIVKNADDLWEIDIDARVNRRITGRTEIPFAWPHEIKGSSVAMGTLGNCSGGVTPWGTILTCEENYDMFYGETDAKTGERITVNAGLGWYEHFDNPPEHYGWVVEVEPQSGNAKKLVSLGRFAHECATVAELDDGRLVVYSGDDAINKHLYKFISSKPGSLDEGELYAANLILGKWIPLKWDESKVLQKLFADQTDVQIRTREAARLSGASPLDRPEDIEIDPITGAVFVSLTNNTTISNYFGSILKIQEAGGRYDAMTFTSETFLAGGEETGFACPDNLAFDKNGNLWFTSDMSTSLMNMEPYLAFKNNGLFLVMREGKQAGQVLQIASAPNGAEFTGPYFTPDGKTLFLSVQHPGENSLSLDQLSSHWPEGGRSVPRPSVVQIQGELLEAIQGV